MIDWVFIMFAVVGTLSSMVVLSTLLARAPVMGFIGIGALVIDQRQIDSLGAVFEISGVSFYVADALSILLFSSGIIRLYVLHQQGVRSVSPPKRLLIASFSVLVFFSLLRGIQGFGLSSSMNEARSWIYLLSVGLWVLSLRPQSEEFRRTIVKWSAWLVVGLTVVAILGFLTTGLGSATDYILLGTGEYETIRPLSASQTMMLALSGFVLFDSASNRRNRWHFILALAAFALVILLQHRSVWAALIGSCIAILLCSDGRSFRVGLLVISSLGFLGISLAIAGLIDPIITVLQESATSTGTYDGRVSGWLALIDKFHTNGPLEILFGTPMGGGWERVQLGRLVTWSPHNWYVTVLLRVGYAGLLLLVFGLCLSLLANISRRRRLDASILLGAVFYFWSYGLEWYFLPFLALAFFPSTNLEHDREGRDFIAGNPQNLQPEEFGYRSEGNKWVSS